jgi:hypothetical protein
MKEETMIQKSSTKTDTFHSCQYISPLARARELKLSEMTDLD